MYYYSKLNRSIQIKKVKLYVVQNKYKVNKTQTILLRLNKSSKINIKIN